MAITRSPRYPNVAISEALSKARAIYEKEHMSPLTPQVAAEAMGYSGINGASLKMISSLKKYNLLEGRGDDVRLTKDAQTLIIDDKDSRDYIEAMRRCALNPEVYGDIRRQFQSGGSERNIAVFLEKQGYKPEAAINLARNYKESMALVSDDSGAYNPSEQEPEPAGMTVQESNRAVATLRAADAGMSATIQATKENDIKITLDGDWLRVSAYVNKTGIEKLKKVLDANAPFLGEGQPN